MIRDILINNNIKVTKQRLDILSLITESSEVTIKDIESKLSNIDQSTIYRTLELFLKKNIIIKSINSDNKTIYEFKDKHKHILNCIKCHKRIELEECPFEKDIEQIDGFIILNHTINIEGICKKCSKH